MVAHSANRAFGEDLQTAAKLEKVSRELIEIAKDETKLPTVIGIDESPVDFRHEDVSRLTDYLPEVAPKSENWWTRFLTPRVEVGNYQRKREVFAGFRADGIVY